VNSIAFWECKEKFRELKLSVVHEGPPIPEIHEGNRNSCIGESRWYLEMRAIVFLQVAAASDIQSSQLSTAILHLCALYVRKTA
jgi:hypothetical protein